VISTLILEDAHMFKNIKNKAMERYIEIVFSGLIIVAG